MAGERRQGVGPLQRCVQRGMQVSQQRETQLAALGPAMQARRPQAAVSMDVVEPGQVDGLRVRDTGQAVFVRAMQGRWLARPSTGRLTQLNGRWLDGEGPKAAPQDKPGGSWMLPPIEASTAPRLPYLHVSCGIELMMPRSTFVHAHCC
jgi:hypothetical protein